MSKNAIRVFNTYSPYSCALTCVWGNFRLKTWQKAKGKGQSLALSLVGAVGLAWAGVQGEGGVCAHQVTPERATHRRDCGKWFSRPSQSADTMNEVQPPNKMLNPKGCLGQYVWNRFSGIGYLRTLSFKLDYGQYPGYVLVGGEGVEEIYFWQFILWSLYI